MASWSDPSSHPGFHKDLTAAMTQCLSPAESRDPSNQSCGFKCLLPPPELENQEDSQALLQGDDDDKDGRISATMGTKVGTVIWRGLAQEETLCQVCWMKTTGKHVHYGGRACTSCRAFFRRSVQNGAYQGFACAFRGNRLCQDVDDDANGLRQYCEIDSKSWKSCKACRFQLCLNSGMRPAWVKVNEGQDGAKPPETVNRKTKASSSSNSTRMTRGCLQNGLQPVGPRRSSSRGTRGPWKAARELRRPMEMPAKLTVDELEYLIWQSREFVVQAIETYLKYLASAPHLVAEVLGALSEPKTILRYETSLNLRKSCACIVRDLMWSHAFRHCLGAPDPIPIEDWKLLIQHNVPVVKSFSFAVNSFNSHSIGGGSRNLVTCISPILNPDLFNSQSGDVDRKEDPKVELPHPPLVGQQHLRLLCGHSPQARAFREMYESFNIAPDQAPSGTLAYHQVFASPWAPSREDEERHLELTKGIAHWPLVSPSSTPSGCNGDDDRAGPGTVDGLLVFLLCMVLISSPEGIVLELRKPEAVSRLQTGYLAALNRYLKLKYPKDANNRLAKGIDLMSMAREAASITSKVLPV